jgi:hypothetical protein
MVEYTGWITKEGGSVIKNWKRRWAVVNSFAGTLSYYEKPEDVSNPLGIVIVRGSTISSVPKNTKKRDFCFSIISLSKKFYAAVDTEEEYNEWIKVLNSASTGAMIDEQPDVNLDAGVLFF